MPLVLPPKRYNKLHQLVVHYNTVPEMDKAQQLFYLQKINYVLNTLDFDEQLVEWIHRSEEDGWKEHLTQNGIHPYASFFVKTYQFAEAVDKATLPEDIGTASEKADIYKNIHLQYDLMQRRDELFEDGELNYKTSRTDYIQLSKQLNKIRESNETVQNKFIEHLNILELAKEKIESIVNPPKETSNMPNFFRWLRRNGYKLLSLLGYNPVRGYKTEVLGEVVNNHNFKFTMPGKTEPFIFRVESRQNWKHEQALQKYAVSKYFIEDYAGFMMAFKDEDDYIQYQPVVLSQFAQQGDLRRVAKNLDTSKHSRLSPIPSKVDHYFLKLIDLCNLMVESKHYHPDIKLSNFLVDKYLIRISDRKTIIKEQNPFAYQIMSSPLYAPEEYLTCVKDDLSGFNHKAFRTQIDMPSFMAFQIGMALKEFLILSHLKQLPDDETFRNPDIDVASYFDTPSNAIKNYSLLIQELTRVDPKKRLSIAQLKHLIFYKNFPTAAFYQELEKVLPASTLGIEEDMDEINQLIKSDLTGDELLNAANLIFKKVDKMTPKEHRISHLAEKLAAKCFQTCSKDFFTPYAEAVEEVMTQKADYDWEQASLYRKFLHVISFGKFPVNQTDTDQYLATKSIALPVDNDEFLRHFPLMNYLQMPELHKAYGTNKASNLALYIISHLKDIVRDEPLSASSDKEAISTGLSVPSAKQTEGEPSGTMVINEQPSGTMVVNEQPSGTMVVNEQPSGTMVVNEQPSGTMVINEQPSGTMVVKDSDKKKKDSVAEHGMFSPAPEQDSMDNKNIRKPTKRNIIQSYRSTLFRGDGSLRGMQIKRKQRKGLSMYTFHPENSEITTDRASPEMTLSN